MIDAQFGTDVGILLMHRLVQVFVHGRCMGWYRC
jgi:hypothetical protein